MRKGVGAEDVDLTILICERDYSIRHRCWLFDCERRKRMFLSSN